MKVLFLNPPFLGKFSRSQRSPAITKSGTLYYPVWLSYAAGVMEKAGFEVKLIDAVAAVLTPKMVFRKAVEFDPRLIVIDTSTPSIYNDIKIGAALKDKLPASFIVVVGTHVSALPDETLRLNENIDAVAKGEYDYTLCDLAAALEKNGDLKNVLGISYRYDKDIISNPLRPKIDNLDEVPFVTGVYKKHLNIKDYFFAASNYPQVQLFTGRGCPFQCFFCVYPQIMHGHTYRVRSAQNVVDEFKFIRESLPYVKEIVIEDDTFTIDTGRVKQICQLLLKENKIVTWNANVRANLDLDTMQMMKAAGCRLIIVGFESADQTVLDNIQKGIQVGHMEKFFQNAKKAKLMVHAAFMAGNPGETRQTLEKTLQFSMRMLPDTVQFFPLMVYPGTKAYAWALKHKFLKTTNYGHWLTQDGLHNCFIDSGDLKAQDLVDWCDQSRRRYYLNPRYLLYKTKQMLLHPEEARRTFRAALQFRKYILRGIFK